MFFTDNIFHTIAHEYFWNCHYHHYTSWLPFTLAGGCRLTWFSWSFCMAKCPEFSPSLLSVPCCHASIKSKTQPTHFVHLQIFLVASQNTLIHFPVNLRISFFYTNLQFDYLINIFAVIYEILQSFMHEAFFKNNIPVLTVNVIIYQNTLIFIYFE